MQTRNQISLTRKTLYGIMLLGLFFSAFGVGNFSSASVWLAENELPEDKILKWDTELWGEIPADFGRK